MIFTYFRTREGKVSGLKTICVTDAVLIWIPDLPVVSPLVLFARATTNPLLYLYFTKSWPRADGFFFSPLVFIFGLWDCHVFLSAALFFYQTPAIIACMQSHCRTSLKENRPQSLPTLTVKINPSKGKSIFLRVYQRKRLITVGRCFCSIWISNAIFLRLHKVMSICKTNSAIPKRAN